MALTQEQIKNLKKGQSLRVTTFLGLGGFYLDAKVIVVLISTIGCLIRVTEILSQGEANLIRDGKELVATFDELRVLPE